MSEQVLTPTRPPENQGSAVRAFPTADIRGYSTFTQEWGHKADSLLAGRSVSLALDTPCDVASLKQIRPNMYSVDPPHGMAGFAGSGPNESIVIVNGVGSVYVYPATVAQWEQAACAVAGRNLTRAEWRQYVPDRPYQKTCPDQP